jgi:hypothetical protein
LRLYGAAFSTSPNEPRPHSSYCGNASKFTGMITVLDFNQMALEDQASVAITGTFLGDRRQGAVIVQLQRLDNFYIEVFYDPLQNEILRYEGFTSVARLAPYIKL